MPRKQIKRPKSDMVSTTNPGNDDEIISEVMYKLVIIGNTHVGRTSLMLRYSDNIFRDKHISTIGVDFKIVKVKVGTTCVSFRYGIQPDKIDLEPFQVHIIVVLMERLLFTMLHLPKVFTMLNTGSMI